VCFEGGVERGGEVVGILDMRDGKHKLNFVVGSDLIPFVIINLPVEEMSIAVFSLLLLLLLYIVYYYYLFLYFLFYKD
jgi:hypothetical protein